MDLSVLIPAAYFALKAAAYCAWCWLGVRSFRPERGSKVGLGLALGLLRLGLGLVFGLGIFLGGAAAFEGFGRIESLDRGAAMLLTYLVVYVPVRWIEWGVIEFLLTPGARRVTTILTGSARGLRWRLGGIAVSCLADVPLMLALGGIPVGRFAC